MKNALTALLVVLAPATVFAGEWKSDYATALKEAKAQDKPLLVSFTNGDANADAKFADQSKLDSFVLLKADKSTPEGAQLFTLFQMPGDHGVVVIERDGAWQFCRFERDLSASEIGHVLAQTATAKGKPQVEVATAASSQSEDKAEAASSESIQVDSYCPSCSRRRR